MKPSSLFLGLVAPFAASAFECLNGDHDHDILNISAKQAKASLNGLQQRPPVSIALYFHLLLADNTPDPHSYVDGVHSQVAYMQKHFNPWGFSFNLKGIDAVVNADWAREIDTGITEKTHVLHKGDYKTLNIYGVEGTGGGIGSMPDPFGEPITQTQLEADMVFVPLSVVINGSCATTVHEIGHWFGLFHVFDGGCYGNGDFCDDTNYQAKPSLGKLAVAGDIHSCPAPNSCPNQPGKDNCTTSWITVIARTSSLPARAVA